MNTNKKALTYLIILIVGFILGYGVKAYLYKRALDNQKRAIIAKETKAAQKDIKELNQFYQNQQQEFEVGLWKNVQTDLSKGVDSIASPLKSSIDHSLPGITKGGNQAVMAASVNKVAVDLLNFPKICKPEYTSIIIDVLSYNQAYNNKFYYPNTMKLADQKRITCSKMLTQTINKNITVSSALLKGSLKGGDLEEKCNQYKTSFYFVKQYPSMFTETIQKQAKAARTACEAIEKGNVSRGQS